MKAVLDAEGKQIPRIVSQGLPLRLPPTPRSWTSHLWSLASKIRKFFHLNRMPRRSRGRYLALQSSFFHETKNPQCKAHCLSSGWHYDLENHCRRRGYCRHCHASASFRPGPFPIRSRGSWDSGSGSPSWVAHGTPGCGGDLRKPRPISPRVLGLRGTARHPGCSGWEPQRRRGGKATWSEPSYSLSKIE